MKITNEKKKQIVADKDQLSVNQISQKYNIPLVEIKKIINASEKKTPKWFYTVLILFPILFLVGLETFLSSIDYGYNLDQWVDAGQGKYIINPEIGRRYFTSGDFNPNTIEDVFDQRKSANSFRVFVLGGSSAQGFPFNPMGSFSRYIRKRLELVYPATKTEVINISMTAVNSYTILDLLPGVLEQEPDVILIYAGHNEYYGALGVGSMESYGSSRFLVKLVLFLNKFKTTQLVRNSIKWASSLFAAENNKHSGTLMSRMAKDKYIILNTEEFNAGVRQFKENLKDILGLIKGKEVPVILGRLVSNLKDQKPFVSVGTPGYRTAEEVYEEAKYEFENNNFSKADSLFRQAKELDALRFRAPEKINSIIDELGKESGTAIVPIDSIFNSASPCKIVGDNLIADHLHPNVEGYQLIGKAFYERMEKLGYLPRTEKPAIPLDEQDSLTRVNFVFTKLDSVMGAYFVDLLKSDYPYKKEKAAISKFQQRDFVKLFKPDNFIDSLAMIRIENKISWVDAHLIAATYYLRRDDIKEYLNYMNVLIYQYPGLKDLDGALKYFYEQKKINLADYTPKRNGIMALYIGNFDNAIRHLTQAYNSNPEDPSLLYNLSLAYTGKNDFDSALSLINKCLIADPDYPDAENLKQRILKEVDN
ncbi:MAG: tetratricopeptide repeat protein [Melioribacteraceae bacterium]|nr:tetratricopeptide repeat protein [Melioribacteraceae bacterium]